METNKKNSGMPVASLVLGIVSLIPCLGLLTCLPAIILGHIAYNRARKQPDLYDGSGLAIAGFVTGYAGLLVTILLLGALPAPRTKALRIHCVSNLKQIGTSFRQRARITCANILDVIW